MEARLVTDRVVDYSLSVEFLKLVKRDPYLKQLAINLLQDFLKEDYDRLRTIVVSEEHLEKYRKVMASRARKTRQDNLRYLRKAMNFELNPSRIEDYFLELREEGEGVARHTARALKSFIKHVLKSPSLYNCFKTLSQPDRLVAEPLALEQVKAVANAIERLGAKVYYILLAEAGLKPFEVHGLMLEHLNLEARTITLGKVGETKRSYIAFIPEKTKSFLKDNYLPFRSMFIDRYAKTMGFFGHNVEEWKRKLLPFKQAELRHEIYLAMDKALGRRFRLYDLKAFYSSYMSLKRGPCPSYRYTSRQDASKGALRYWQADT